MSHRVFRRKLVEQLVALGSNTAVTKPIVGRPTGKILEPLNGRHFPAKIATEHAECKKQNPTRLCVVCNPAERQILQAIGQKRRRPGKETRYMCKQCNVSLCIEPCFELYHTKQEYILGYKRIKQQEDLTQTNTHLLLNHLGAPLLSEIDFNLSMDK